jgi:hypothetical protein
VTVRGVVRIALVIGLTATAACSDDDVDPEAADATTSTVPDSDPSCWDLIGQTIEPEEPNYCETGTDTKTGHGFQSITCEEGPDLAFIGGQHDPILLYGRMGEKWRRFEGTADFPKTSGEPYRACRPSEPPCRGDAPPGSPDACPGG